MEGLKVVPSDIGIHNPFKVELDKVYVPPYSYVKKTLQYESSQRGLSDIIYNYVKKFVSFGLGSLPSKKDPTLNAITKIVSSRETVSDKIIKYVKQKGHSLKKKLPEKFARELALKSCDKLEKEIEQIMDRMLVIDHAE